jgi:hypothetical protein
MLALSIARSGYRKRLEQETASFLHWDELERIGLKTR